MLFPCPLPVSRLTLLSTLLCIAQLFTSAAFADDPGETEASPYIRFHRTARSQATLDTSVCTYRHPRSGRTVGLVGAVHVADRSYFRAIQEELDRFDLVLFERVGTPEERDSEFRKRLSIIGELQYEVADLLELHHQGEALDYDRKTFRHADLTLAGFQQALEERGESLIPAEGLVRLIAPFLKMSFSLSRSMRALDPHQTNRLRWQMGETLGNVDRVLGRLGIEDRKNPDDVIIGVRNDHAWRVFQEALPENHQRIAIFYGAAHMPDFDRRLQEEGWERIEVRWIPAWQIPAPDKEDETQRRPARPREARL